MSILAFASTGMVAVNSTDLRAVRYDEWSGTLVIAFHSGGVYEYYNVPYSEYAGLMRADSHGRYFHAHIKGHYDYRRIG
ncbi:MAG: KTSC domain-containing protein [Verrucomicrobia bacterium]|nr:KTSC domain-containing protein [Verrucomicrobiota bacterium]